ncbi:TauD/TfdA family dioxygenase [Paraglaciecola chathamensis]|uniref:Clavaminate synthase-like protein At3g21360 n=1 Tax=Paraglaciecola agarilytica NO2 TaxID=1125747 RepID=A0ABQ0IEB3_9ALTE|nr:TauD/TfdA family dioxygenase [Paraglaciecola agarilytica]GAC07364.1 clavaminate synthase-like protein At3g21360 [Paraglaciecola agarilytica NO2]
MSEQAINYVDVPHQLKSGDSVFPRVVLNDGSLQTLDECAAWIEQNKAALEAELKKSGAILFRGFPLNSAETFDEFSNAFGYPNFTYKESLSNAVRINFTERVFTANEAPKHVEIFLHHEMAQTPISPSKVFFFCKTAADEGGATPICRSDLLFAELKAQQPALAQDFINKGLKYTTHMPSENDVNSGQGRSWKSTLSVESQAEAEAKLKELGYSWEWTEDGGLRATTPVLPAVVKLENGKEVFYNQLIAAFMGWKGVRENPSSAITFGDGSAIPVEGLQLATDLAKDYTFDLPWQDGDVALVDNYMSMHGRRSYSGERKREVLVALAMD